MARKAKSAVIRYGTTWQIDMGDIELAMRFGDNMVFFILENIENRYYNTFSVSGETAVNLARSVWEEKGAPGILADHIEETGGVEMPEVLNALRKADGVLAAEFAAAKKKEVARIKRAAYSDAMKSIGLTRTKYGWE